MMRGKWKIKELQVRWFCRNCWQKGVAAITLHPAIATAMDKSPTIGYHSPTPDDIVRIIQTTCHTDCSKPNIRIHHDSRSQLER